MSEETWLPVVGHEGRYSVSSLGRVRRDAPGKATHAGRILRPAVDHSGYAYINLCRNGHHQCVKVHCLVMAAFVGLRPPGMQINHKNGSKTDNSVGNLEYLTASENIRHAFRTGLKRGRVGELHGGAILTESAVRAIKAALAAGQRQRDLARQFGVSRYAIGHIAQGRTWRHVA